MDNDRLFQRYELEAFLGDYVDDYDVDAIIEEVTAVNYKDGNRYWTVDANELVKAVLRHLK